MKGRFMRCSPICAASIALVASVVGCSDGSVGGAPTGASGSGNSTAGTSSTGGSTPGASGTGPSTAGTGVVTDGGSSSPGTAGSGSGGASGSAAMTAGTGGMMTTTTAGAAGTSSGGGGSGAGGTGGGGLKTGPFKILVLSTTLEFHHDSIATCDTMLNDLGKATAPERATITGLAADTTWTVDHMGTDPKAANYFSEMTAENLAKYDILYSNNPTGPVFTQAPDGANKKMVFQTWFDGGGSWAGQHSATDFENNSRWTWWDDHVAGGWFVDHDGPTTPGTISWQSQYADHPIVKGLTSPWNTSDEWYIMNRDIESVPGFKILGKVTVSTSSKPNGAQPRPAVWITDTGKGRGFYTIRGHDISRYAEPEFRQLMLRGLLWDAHRLPGGN